MPSKYLDRQCVGFRDLVGAPFSLAVKRDLPLPDLQMPLGIERLELLAITATLYPVGLFSQHFSFMYEKIVLAAILLT